MILIDSSVLIDLLEKTPKWFDWSSEQLYAASQRDRLGINALIFAETARSFASVEAQNSFLKSTNIVYLSIPAQAAYAASMAHKRYRAAGGERSCTLPDFFIGAHAQVEEMALMTRDARRIKTYFPEVSLITP